MYEAKINGYEKLGENVCKKLNSLGYSAQFAGNKEAALKAALQLIPDGASVGIPGTVTVREIGLIDELKKRGSSVALHWDPNLKPEDRKTRLMEEMTSDWLVTSTNALSADEGVFVNIDGTGNRVGAMAWAPGKLLYIVGINKITPDLDTALKRVRNTATPPNSIRLDYNVPCASIGRCVNCNSPERVCRIVTMMERPPFGRDCYVIIVGEELGY
ncbi:MAG: lactate utilization protein [Synergistaceae bacterium]|nr:lactate utilization protein [Synergistaceae bacterium]